jgi:hypothetical protein
MQLELDPYDANDPLSIPEFLRLTPEQREAGWKGKSLRPISAFIPVETDPEKVKIAAEVAERKKIKTDNRIGKMLAKKTGDAEKQAGKKWDVRTARWV